MLEAGTFLGSLLMAFGKLSLAAERRESSFYGKIGVAQFRRARGDLCSRAEKVI